MTTQNHHQLNYLEMPSSDISACKKFFAEVFGWTFTDYGPDYTCFVGQQIEGGFFTSEHVMNTEKGSALVVLYSKDLESTQSAVEKSGGLITQAIFSFPGGRRFHFTEPSGNEFSVWSE